MEEERKAGLSVRIVGDMLMIHIGIATLGVAATAGRHFDNDAGDDPKITDERAFAEAIADELRDEEEDGTTLVHRMFDQAAKNAVENGCDGIELPGD